MRAVRVQTVRYGNDGAALARMIRSVAAASRYLRKEAGELELSVAVGDCGGEAGHDAVLDDVCVAELDEVITGSGGRFEYSAFGANVGHGGGHNRLLASGAAEATTPADTAAVVVFADPDTYLPPGSLASLVAALDDPSVGIAEGRQIPLEHPKPFDLATGDTPWASACLMAVRAGLLAELGGFEEAFFLHGDDVDLSWRARLASRGGRVVHVPPAAVFHDKRPEPNGFPLAGTAEEYHAMWARLVLAHRAERPDVIDRWSAWAMEHGSALHRDAVAEFRRRRTADGLLPATYRVALGVSSALVSSVATFHEADYAEHRF